MRESGRGQCSERRVVRLRCDPDTGTESIARYLHALVRVRHRQTLPQAEITDRRASAALTHFGSATDVDVPKTQAPELRALLGLHDSARLLLTAHFAYRCPTKDCGRDRSWLSIA